MYFPKNFSELTLDFLNSVLEKEFNSRIKSFTKGKELEPGFTGKVHRISLVFTEEKDNLPKSLIIKFQTSNSGVNAFMTKIKGYEKKLKIYKIISNIIELNLPKIYYTQINEEGSKYIMVMEDLEERGSVKPDREKPYDVKIFKLIAEYFSKLQSNFWSKESQKDIEWIKNNNFGEYMKEFTTYNFDKKRIIF